MSNWISYVKQVQKQHNCSYKEALTLASKTYKKGGSLKDFTNAFKKVGRDFKRAGEKMQRGFNKVGNVLNPFNNKGFKDLGAKAGDLTNNQLLPATQQIGTEVYKKGLQILDPFTGGLSSSAGNLLYNKMGKKFIRQPKNNLLKGITNVGKVGVQLYKP